jgi:hypothetical protein
VRSPFRYFHSLVLALFGTLAYKLLALSPVLASDPDYGVHVLAAVAFLLWMLFSMSRAISDKLLEWLPRVRALFAGHKHIEGDWPLVVVDIPTGQMVYYGFLTIGFKDGQYSVSGDDWHPDGRHAHFFEAKQTYQDHPTLHYWYVQAVGKQRGYTFIEFFPRDAVPERHTGVFHDKDHPDVRFYARKLNYRMFQRRLRRIDQRKQAAAAFAEEIAPRLPELARAGVDADWV